MIITKKALDKKYIASTILSYFSASLQELCVILKFDILSEII